MADYGGPQGFGGTTPGGPNTGGALGGASAGSGYGPSRGGVTDSQGNPVGYGVDSETGTVKGFVVLQHRTLLLRQN